MKVKAFGSYGETEDLKLVEIERRPVGQDDIEIDIDSWYFPDIDIPEGKNYDDYLREVTYEGISKRGMEQTEEIEILKSIEEYPVYFLLFAYVLLLLFLSYYFLLTYMVYKVFIKILMSNSIDCFLLYNLSIL
mgnify:CR=1 FL=1